MRSRTSISIVIRTFNSAKTLGQVLKALRLISCDELIVVDSGSTDSTLDIATRYRANILIAPPPFHYSKSLNIGFTEAKNPWVLVLSSHSIPICGDFMAMHREAIAVFPETVIAGYAPSTLTGSHSPILNADTSLFTKNDYERVCEAIVGNGNTIYRRSAWEELQFDETIKTAEDKLWLKEMVARDYGFAYIPKPCAITKYRGSLRYMFTKGYVDARAARGSNIAPMKIMHLGGAVKNILLNGLNGKIDPQTLLRILSSTLGQFFGSYKDYKNSNFFIL